MVGEIGIHSGQKWPGQKPLTNRYGRGGQAPPGADKIHPPHHHQHHQKTALQQVDIRDTSRTHQPSRQGRHREHHRKRGDDQLPDLMLRPLGSQQRHRRTHPQAHHHQPHAGSGGRSLQQAGSASPALRSERQSRGHPPPRRWYCGRTTGAPHAPDSGAGSQQATGGRDPQPAGPTDQFRRKNRCHNFSLPPPPGTHGNSVVPPRTLPVVRGGRGGGGMGNRRCLCGRYSPERAGQAAQPRPCGRPHREPPDASHRFGPTAKHHSHSDLPGSAFDTGRRCAAGRGD